MGGAAAGGGAANEPSIPEKYQVKKADGSLDLEATSKKLAGGYGELDKRMKEVGLPPESADKYEIVATDDTVKEAVAAIVAAPEVKEILGRLHAARLSNKQASVVLTEYAQAILSQVEETKDNCVAELGKLPGGTAGVNKLLQDGHRAALVFGERSGIKFEDIEKAGLANNPLFCRIMAAIGKELPEDLPGLDNNGSGEGGKSFEEQTAELRAEMAKLDIHDPKRKGIQTKLDALYNRKYPATKPILQGAA